MHLLTLHEHGSSNPLGVSGNTDRLPFHPYFTFKDLVTIFAFLLALSVFVFYMPNAMGHSDNYIPANPMQTPPSIACLLKLLAFLSLVLSFLVIACALSDLLLGCSPETPSLTHDGVSGTVRLDGKLVTMTKSQLLALLKKAGSQKLPLDPAAFRSLCNGVFQAEGHWGGYFPTLTTLSFRPLWFISQNASTESIRFFGQLFQALDGHSMDYYLSLTVSGHWHIRLQSRSWDHIVQTIIPYFNQLYVEKYSGLLKMLRIHSLLTDGSLMAKVELINLAYSMTSSGWRNVPLLTKLQAVTGLLSNPFTSSELDTATNPTPFNLAWYLGFFIGDGTIGVRLRDEVVGIQIIPLMRLTQKLTALNSSLFADLATYLRTLGLTVIIDNQGSNLELRVEGKGNVTLLMELLAPYSQFFLWKSERFTMLSKLLYLMGLSIRNWQGLQEAIIRLIFQVENNRDYSLSHYLGRISQIFYSQYGGNVDYFLSPSTSKGGVGQYVVTLPSVLGIKPRQKYFSAATYGSLASAKSAALAYRDAKLSAWLDTLNQEYKFK